MKAFPVCLVALFFIFALVVEAISEDDLNLSEDDDDDVQTRRGRICKAFLYFTFQTLAF